MTLSSSTIVTSKYSGYDLYFEIPATVPDNTSIIITTNIGISVNSDSNSRTKVKITKSQINSVSRYLIQILDETDVAYEGFLVDASFSPRSFRIFAYATFLGIYVNNIWVHTFYFSQITYPDYYNQSIKITTSGNNLVLSNICKTELFDWRSAIYADLDSVAANALSSVIQTRPIDVIPTYQGKVKFIYSEDAKRDQMTLNAGLITELQETHDPSSAMSDAVVYGATVQVLTDSIAASEYGFVTKMIRIPELDNGTRRAAQVLMKQARQKAITYTITMRSDFRIEYGDVINISYILSSTNKAKSVSIIVESISINYKDGSFVMSIQGRDFNG